VREACRLLVETRKTVGEIAAELNFADPLYFSRRFKQLVGVPATEYRATHDVLPHGPAV
jgi:AraC-like DNA-binding protein